MHISIRIFELLFFVTMVIVTSGCVPALKVSVVGRAATATAVEVPAVVSPPATTTLPAAVDEVVIVMRGSPSDGLGGFPQWQYPHPAGIPAVFPMDRLERSVGEQKFQSVPPRAQPTFVPEVREWRAVQDVPQHWKNQFPHVGWYGNHQRMMLITPQVPTGAKISSEKQISRIVTFFNERAYWRVKMEPIGTRPVCWGGCIPQPDIAIYFLYNGRVVGSRGLKGYELWAGAQDNSLYRILTIDEVRELEELGIHHKVK